jgi:uncharacterized damage-inducible protein DinB
MHYPQTAIDDALVPRAAVPLLQHVVDTYASETNKVAAVWRGFTDADLPFRPHPRSTPVAGILKHQLLSERRFFGEFLGAPEPPAAEVTPEPLTIEAAIRRLCDLAVPRLAFLAARPEGWWLERVAFFDVERERIWIVWRRILHTAHHRTQLAVYLRLLDRPVPPTYGPTADATWTGADPTTTADAASRR